MTRLRDRRDAGVASAPLVVKLGGSLLEDAPGRAAALAAVAERFAAGGDVVLVHGGGKRIDALLGRLGIPRRVHAGLRVTDAETLAAVTGALCGNVNKELVRELSALGARSAGISGADGETLRADRHPPVDGVDLGFVGRVAGADTRIVRALLGAGALPVVASIAAGPEDAPLLNVNADTAAAALAVALGASRLVFLTDVEGVLGADGRVVRQLSASRIEGLLAPGSAVTGGMQPKLRACLEAVQGGVTEVVIAGPRRHRAALSGEKEGRTLSLPDTFPGAGPGPRAGSQPLGLPGHPERTDLSPGAVEARDAAWILGTYVRTSFHPREGRGARLVDAEGRVVWDLLAGIAVNALGHRHPRLVRALREESTHLLHVSNLFYHPAQGLLAERLTRASGLSSVFFCNSGTEAIEAALKFARLRNPGREEIVALEGSFHGRSFGALSITGNDGYRAPFAPLVPGARFVPPNDAEALARAVSERTSAIVLEPILGEGGIVPLAASFLAAARREADRVGATLIFDEIQCGLGRTGTLFAFQRSGVVPDAVALAKPLGGGLPLGALLVGPRVASLVKPGMHGTTFGGNPLACRLGLEVLAEIEEKDLLARVTALGVYLGGALGRLKARCAAIVDVRGTGLIWGIELDREAGPVARELLRRGFVVGTARARVLRLLPPYIVPKSALGAFVTSLEEALKENA